MMKRLAGWVEKRTILNLRKAINEEIPERGVILDCGCGNFGSWDYTKWGADIIERGTVVFSRDREIHPVDKKYGVDCVDMHGIPDNSYDVVVFAGVIQYVEEHERAIREIERVLKPYGKMVITTINDDCLWRGIELIKSGPKSNEVKVWTWPELRKLFGKHRILREKGVDFIPLPKEWCSNILMVVENNGR